MYRRGDIAMRRVLRAVVVPLVLVLAGCEMSFGNLAGRATDEWTHTYPLQPGGEIQIDNANGAIDVTGIDGSTVEVKAERIAKAATDEGARELLPRIKITENATPDRIVIETEKMSGIMMGVSTEVRYHVRAPKSAKVRLINTNGRVNVTGMTGDVIAKTSNGGVVGKDLAGPVSASTTNGGVAIDLASLGAGPIELSTTNGGVALSLPESAKADVDATCTNGGIRITGLTLQLEEQSRRRVKGTLNGGGTSVRLHTTNGGVRLRSRQAAADAAEDKDPKDK
jgi:hypothetical protein